MNINPSEYRDTPRAVRVLSSWKLWLPMLFASLSAVALTIAIPAHRRLRALEYFDEQYTTYEFVGEENWLTKRLGSSARGFRHLESIHLQVVSNESLSYAARFPEIRELVADGYLSIRLGSEREGIHPLSESAAHSVRNLNELTTLKLWLTDTDDRVIAEMLVAKPNLQSLELHADCGRETLAAICELQTLKQLVLDGDIPDDAFAGLPAAPSLAECAVSRPGTQCMEWLAQCSQLRHLRFTRHLFINSDFFAGIEKLESLAFEGTLLFLDGDSMKSLQNLRTLEILSDQLEIEFVNALHSIPNLKTIKVVEEIEHDAIRIFLRNEAFAERYFAEQAAKAAVIAEMGRYWTVEKYSRSPFDGSLMRITW